VLDVGWWISLFAYKPLPSARRSRERKKKRTGPLTDITTYTQEYVYKRLSGRELTNGESSRLVIIQSGRERGLPPLTMHKRLTSFVSSFFFLCSVGFSSRYVFLLTQLRNCVKRYAYTDHLVFPIRWERNENSYMKTTATQTHQFWRPFSFSPR
jgi:hypothetical protein